MDNTRSYLSRFSGLGLFILALLVVGALVWLTVRSADDNTATNGADEQTTQQEEEPTDATPFDENDTADERADDDATAEDDENGDQDDAGAVAGGQDENTGANGTLPNTGPESVVSSAALLTLVTWLIFNYRQSVVELKSTQK